MADETTPSSPYVFLSYASTDHKRAVAVADALEAAGLHVWLDREAIAGGTSWGSEIVEGIKGCAALLICCTEAALGSRNVRQEIQLAWRYERAYLPLLLEAVQFPEQVQYFLEGWQWVELRDRSAEQWLPDVVRALQRLGVQPATPVAAPAVQQTTTGLVPEAPAQAAMSGATRPLDRLPLDAFVGRERELTALRAALENALAGQGRLVMLAGEPGIGKTRLAEQLASEARERGCLVLWGRCWEGEGAPAYRPWVETLRAAIRETDPQQLAAELGAGAADIAQIVPEVGALLPGLPPLSPAEPEQARFRLFDAVVAYLRAVAARQPLLIVLDDLHWADKPSLLLLQFLMRDLGAAPMLLLGTYRDVELGRTHPLAETLAALRRERQHERLLLQGLSEPETLALLAAVAEQELGSGGKALAAALHRETEGNPFFLQETLRHLVESGKLVQQGGRWISAVAGIAELGIPEGVREVIGRRLSRLSEDCNRLLGVAAVCGREFEAGTLARVGGADEDALDAALGEAEAARLVAAVPGASDRLRFSHALVQQTLYEELPARRRARLHRQVGEALAERYARNSAGHAAELAYHFNQAGEAATDPALRYSLLAAEQAEATAAWEEAAKHYERALALIEELGEAPAGVDDAALLTALGRCHRNEGEYRAAWRSLMRAIDRYRARNDAVGMATATLEAARILGPPERMRALIDAALAALGQEEPQLTAHLLLITLRYGGLGSEERGQTVARLAKLAETHDLADIQAQLLGVQAQEAAGDLRFAEALRLFQAAGAALRSLGNVQSAAEALSARDALFAWHGRSLDEGETIARDALAQIRAFHFHASEQLIIERLAGLALARCDDGAYEALAAEQTAGRLSYQLQLAQRAERSGDLHGALAALPELQAAGGFPGFLAYFHAGRARVRLNADDRSGAKQELTAAAEAFERIRSDWRFGFGALFIYSEMDEALAALADDALAQAVYDEMAGWDGVYMDPLTSRCAVRVRASLALRVGKVEAAAADYRDALAWCERERLPIEQGRCLQGLAEIARRRNDQDEAQKLLASAAALFEQHGALLYLRQVQAGLGNPASADAPLS